MDTINLIIPCCGEGRRFIDAGYKQYKPTLTYLGKPMLHHVIEAFPAKTQVWIITDVSHTLLLKELVKGFDNTHIVETETHKNGPGFSIASAFSKLPQHQPVFVAYNDVWWKWDFGEVVSFIEKTLADGVVFTHTGFHPHLFRNNFSAFCKTDGNKLKAIKEKGSFTDNCMTEPLSTGVYYFSDSALLYSMLQQMIRHDRRVAGEFYPSVVFNDFIAKGKNILTFETRPFIHLGTPEQYEDALAWNRIPKHQNAPHSFPTLIMMCGTGSRMKSIASVNKAGISVDKTELFRFVAKRMASDDNVFLVNRQTLPLLRSVDKSIDIGEQTETQTESLRKALPYLKAKDGLLVCSNDCYGCFDTGLLHEFTGFDMVVFGFKPRLMHRKQQIAHSGFSVSGKHVNSIHYKDCSHADYGFAGIYLFPDINVLQVLNSVDCLRFGSIDDIAVYLLKENYKIGYIILTDYVHLGTPEEFYEYNFWNSLGIE